VTFSGAAVGAILKERFRGLLELARVCLVLVWYKAVCLVLTYLRMCIQTVEHKGDVGEMVLSPPASAFVVFSTSLFAFCCWCFV